MPIENRNRRFLRVTTALFLSTVPLLATVERPKTYVPVPIVRQQTEYSCGAATSLAVLKYWGAFDGDESELYADLKTDPTNGTAPGAIVRVLTDFGLSALYEEGVSIADLRKYLAAGTTPILDLQAWRTDTKTPWKDLWEDGHYVVAVAMDRKNLYVMDPSTDDMYAYVPLTELLDRWHDYGTHSGRSGTNYQLAIVIKGKDADTSFRAPRKVSRMP